MRPRLSSKRDGDSKTPGLIPRSLIRLFCLTMLSLNPLLSSGLAFLILARDTSAYPTENDSNILLPLQPRKLSPRADPEPASPPLLEPIKYCFEKNDLILVGIGVLFAVMGVLLVFWSLHIVYRKWQPHSVRPGIL